MFICLYNDVMLLAILRRLINVWLLLSMTLIYYEFYLIEGHMTIVEYIILICDHDFAMYSSLHFNVFSSILVTLVTAQFIVIRHLVIDALEQ